MVHVNYHGCVKIEGEMTILLSIFLFLRHPSGRLNVSFFIFWGLNVNKCQGWKYMGNKSTYKNASKRIYRQCLHKKLYRNNPKYSKSRCLLISPWTMCIITESKMFWRLISCQSLSFIHSWCNKDLYKVERYYCVSNNMQNLSRTIVCAKRKLTRENKSQKQIQKQPPELFLKKEVLKNFVKFIGKHLCQSLFFN